VFAVELAAGIAPIFLAVEKEKAELPEPSRILDENEEVEPFNAEMKTELDLAA
jgi:hypothetical protein